MKNKQNNGFIKNPFLYILIIVVVITGFQYFSAGSSVGRSQQINYTELVKEIKNGNVKDISYQPNGSVIEVAGTYKKEKKVKDNTGIQFFTPSSTSVSRFTSVILPSDLTVSELQKLASAKGTEITIKRESSSGVWIQVLTTLVPFAIFAFFLFSMMNQGGGGGARGAMSFGRNKARATNKEDIKVRFSDVAGAEEEKQELVEVVEFLKDPKRYTKLGARIPAGVLLEGPPGTGKTLLAKAVAGEAGVPFFSISGSDFVEMFVGVGASRVRSLFEDAKKAAPAIIFIDEIDAVGRQRGVGLGGGNDEREQTLNQLLIEMDGFEGNEGIIVIAATNRSDVLDPALLRPGRFDRKVLVGQPDVKGREAILRVHARNKPLAEDVDLKLVAQQTPGFVGADLENVLNEAALVAARRNKKVIDASDIDEAEDRVIAGPSKKDKTVSQRDRQIVAYHEAGHTIVGLVLSNARVVHKVTIVPRGRAGGYMIALPKEDQTLLSKEDMKEQLAGLMGGRVAEEIIFNVQTTGASNDFEQATQMARAMVTEYGMSEKLGPVQYEGNHAMFGAASPQKSISEQTAYEIDEEVRNLLNEARNKAAEIIQSSREKHKLIAEALLKYETLDSHQIKSLYETGEMPDEPSVSSSHALSYDEVKSQMEEQKPE
ncbi:ATP-dependent zinc metalloprotease FtsH [Streptococcus constellatus subsp. pharyngis]|uniref:ATP-dependent zinc metalloprotease FtsH n=1 Tax=Streptococcus constellatus subsp. pharyngis SK1060 = CCUG 46377 TaxID=1035184 RepID=F9P9C9_STRCV|nr:ATP-dependent zinc metalloprotease FtsH [Streptococcus constellatus]AGU71922.1 cell division protein, putative [Streptococcus constellatus subsp. pharyngis C232]AGU73678.1 cell division protein, putative [Streptococcus constellatus subsp. pharyngis C818]AGU79025.1 cell division protein, putative [Streptococcus constellatus subsp. pharyngis C1050]EGV07576.1 ATP-dependent metallopeptidase HflB [Streptococcus constellatus subsp. pharyngis SK1060 = CCUG 46377]QRP81275.1 ATP-dependent zinc metal